MGQVSSIRVNGGRIYIESGGESRVEPTLHVDDQSSQDNGVGGVLKYRCITARFGFCGINAKERWESNTRAITCPWVGTMASESLGKQLRT